MSSQFSGARLRGANQFCSVTLNICRTCFTSPTWCREFWGGC